MLFFILILFILFTLISFLLAGAFLTIFVQELWYGKKNNAPFVPAPDAVMNDLVQYVPVTSDSVVFDLGSGDGKVLRALYEQYKVGTYVGIERGFVPYLLAKLWHGRIKNITFRRKDIFDVNLAQATIVILYLFPELMNTLLPKLESELKPGTVVYSLDFKFKDKEPAETYTFDQVRRRGKNIYKYVF